nr:cytochrome c biogenesis protein CcsA [uncultured Desulfobacter sp.]
MSIPITSSQFIFYCACALYCLGFVGNLLHQHRTTLLLLGLGAVLHLVSLGLICSNFGVYALGRALRQAVFLPCCLVFIAIFLLRKESAKTASALSIPVLIFTIIALFQPFPAMPPCPMMQTPSVLICQFLQTLAVACFFAGGFYALFFVLKKQHDHLFNQIVLDGFVFYSLAQVFGAVWSYLAWASPFAWMQDHLDTAAIWLVYCGYIHLQYIQKFTIRSKAIWAVSGAAIVLVITVLLPLPTTVTRKLSPPKKPVLSQLTVLGNNVKFNIGNNIA